MCAGFFHYAVLLYWIPFVPAHYGGLSAALSISIYILFVLLLSLIWALFSLIYNKLSTTYKYASFFVAPLIWVSLEYILTYIFTGFPWCLLGYSQFKNIYFIQLATVTGIYGLSFMIIFFQSMFVCSMRLSKKWPFFSALIAIIIVHACGYLSLKPVPASEKNFTAGIIQGNVPSDTYWGALTEKETMHLFNRHLEMSKQAADRGAEIIIWPELSVPLCFGCEEEYYVRFNEKLKAFVRKTRTHLLLGTVETKESQGHDLYFNAAILLSPDLSKSEYHKIHLVPFGEYTPYKKIFFFLEKVTSEVGDLTPGKQHVLHSFDSLSFGSPICYEIIFPQLVRKFVKKGANFLVTITNDGWYRRSSAPFQHFAMAVLRAVENRRFLIRAATTGISGVIDPYGRILARTELLTQTYLTEKITPLERNTFYTRYGDLFSFLSLALASIFFLLTFFRKKHPFLF